jgi:hypothetical protein
LSIHLLEVKSLLLLFGFASEYELIGQSLPLLFLLEIDKSLLFSNSRQLLCLQLSSGLFFGSGFPESYILLSLHLLGLLLLP